MKKEGISRFFKHPVYDALKRTNLGFSCLHLYPEYLNFKFNSETLNLKGIENKHGVCYPLKSSIYAITNIKLDLEIVEELEIVDNMFYVLKADSSILSLFKKLKHLFCIDKKTPWIPSYGCTGDSYIRVKYKSQISPPLEIKIYSKPEDFQIEKNGNGYLFLSLHSPDRTQFSRMQNIYTHDLIEEFNRDIHFKCKYLTGIFLYFMVDGEYKDLKEEFEEVIFVLENLDFPLSTLDLQIYDQEKLIYYLNFLPDFVGKFWQIDDLLEYENMNGMIPNLHNAYCSLHFKTKKEIKGTIHLIQANLNLHFTKNFESSYILLN